MLGYIEATLGLEICREIAKGGMGVVYEAKQLGVRGFEKIIAVKVLLSEAMDDAEFTEMFVGEARLVADLVHENIAQVYHLGQMPDKRRYFLAMEYIDGINLNQLMARHARLRKFIPAPYVAFIISRVCRGLEYAHTKRDRDGALLGVVHRDVSPSNVMTTWQGVVKLTDFGIAKARNLMRDQEGDVLLGKTGYMSPEQAQYQPTDLRSDIFSLGIVMYELLTGAVLFDVPDRQRALRNVLSKPIRPPRQLNPQIPEDLERLLMTALERNPEMRFQTAGEFGNELEFILYNDSFGPTNVKLAKYLRGVFPERGLHNSPRSRQGT